MTKHDGPEHGPGLVGVLAQETARYSFFAASLTALEGPEGTAIKWWYGMDIAQSCNSLVHEMYEQEKEWLWLLGDDHTFSSDLLFKLLDREVDIVTPACLMRTPPYATVVFTDNEDGERSRVALSDYPDGGLIPVHAAGSGGMLIRRRVFDAMPDPWFESHVIDSTRLTEDVYFCDKARAAGAQVFCDLDASLGHCLTSVVWPVRAEDGWTVGFSMMGGYQMIVPAR